VSHRRIDRDPNVLIAYVACGLVPTIEGAREEFEAENTGKSLRIESDEPLSFVRRIEEGEVPDLLICPGEAEIGMLEREGFLDRGSRKVIGELQLAIAVPADRPTAIASPKDLASARVESITMSMPGISSPGTDGKHMLERLGLWSEIQGKLLLQQTPFAALELVAAGEVDAAIVYDPCVRLRIGGEIPRDSVRIAARMTSKEEPPIRAYAIVHKRSPNALLSQRLTRILTNSAASFPVIPSAPSAEGATEDPEADQGAEPVPSP
jgi:ABC-type molybdate transport system substrate-binding protein